MPKLKVQLVPACAPERFIRLGVGLLASMERPEARPTLLVAGLTGEALLLGRHQRGKSALDLARAAQLGLPVLRRLGGGRALHVGDGIVAAYLALPSESALLPQAITPDKVLNRYARGLNLGLSRAGAPGGAFYFGRDFLSSRERRLAQLSQEALPSGATLLEVFVHVTRTTTLPAGLSGYPPEHDDPRALGPDGIAFTEAEGAAPTVEALCDALAQGLVTAFPTELARELRVVGEGELPDPAIVENEERFEESGVTDISIGFCEVLLQHDGGKVGQVRLRGDFIAPAFAVRRLEEELRGKPLAFEELGRTVDAAFKVPHATIQGMRLLRVFPDGILAAAGRL